MTESGDLEAKFVKEFKACKGDDELKIHLKARLNQGTFLVFSTFAHHRLKRVQQFRLLTLLPGALETSVKCELGVYDLDAPPKFLALSYTWGDKTRTLPIECNQQTALISINLYSALIRVRLPDQKLTIWVDALCIDQGTDKDALRERAQQVRRMDQIFSKADEVIIDVGGATKGEVRTFMQGYQDFQKMAFQGPSYDVRFERDDPVLVYGPDHPFWKSWHRFLLRPWFGRIWIVQEFVLARKITKLLGTTKIDPWKLGNLMSKAVFHQGSTSVDVLPRAVMGSLDIAKLKETQPITMVNNNYSNMLYYHGMYELFRQKQSLPDLLDLSRNMKATDLRDHIYALAGLVENWDTLGIDIDYMKSEAETRLSVGRALINMGQTFYCLARSPGIDVSGMTWMPLLRHNHFDRRIDSDLDKNFMGVAYPLYRAAGDTLCTASTSSTTTLLSMKGFRVDMIKTIAPVFPIRIEDILDFSRDAIEASTKLVTWYSALKTWASCNFSEWSMNDVKHNLWRTMVLDVVKDVTKFPPVQTRPTLSQLVEHLKMLDETHEYLSGDSSPEVKREWFQYSQAQSQATASIHVTCSERKICSTAHGRMASVPLKTVHGNEIWIMFGIPLPMVLRNLGSAYAIVGPAYVHGLMDGEALTQIERRDETIYLA